MPNPTLIYFAARGRAEVIRVLLAETGIEYDEQPVGGEAKPGGARGADFAELKASGALPFDAIPVWLEPDGFRLAQSLTIARHIARTHGLAGANPREEALADQMLSAFDDARGEMRRLVLSPPEARPALRVELAEKIVPRWQGYFDRWLGDNEFLVGKQVTVADTTLWYLLEVTHENGFTIGSPRLRSFFERVGARPRLAAWKASPRRHPFVAFPVS